MIELLGGYCSYANVSIGGLAIMQGVFQALFFTSCDKTPKTCISYLARLI